LDSLGYYFEAIADFAEVSVGTIYNHYSCKEKILVKEIFMTI